MPHSYSFLVPVKGRESAKQDLINHLFEHYPECRIIFVYQEDGLAFRKGQLFNIGFNYIKTNILVMIDVDIRTGFIDYQREMNAYNRPMIPYNILNRAVVENGKYKVVKLGKTRMDIGGVTCFTQEQYRRCFGFSNLFFGYGYEDHLLHRRSNLKRVDNTILHIEHLIQEKHPELLAWNKKMLDSNSQRLNSLDGYLQTTCDKKIIEEDNILHIHCSNIGVCSDYKYMSLLEEGLEIERLCYENQGVNLLQG